MDSAPAPPLERVRARIRGAVQGVGFRPHVHALAKARHLAGWVMNDAEGVLLEVEGADLDGFLADVRRRAPPLARIDALETERVARTGEESFEIRASRAGVVATSIIPDAAVCPACLSEMFDPADRRYRYAFLNCTHCGPRYTITAQLPYDRANTAMARFAMCGPCADEYTDPADRRFHAQPTACPACGPRLSHEPAEVLAAIRAGAIVALKGIGGFHLVCDARNEAAVLRLRQRKHRDAKPFAVMAAGLASAWSIAEISAAEAALLTSTQRPIVLCRKAPNAGLAPSIAPGLAEFGVMAPYAPLHYLLFHEAAGRPSGTAWLDAVQDLVLVMTSANPGGEPLVTGNDEARARLGAIADVIVDHDRDILIRADDSLSRVIAGAPAFIRRARGYTPEPIRLARSGPPILALGAHLKTAICVTRGNEAFLSQHVGDLDNAPAYAFLVETIAHLTRLLDVAPERIACDLHPDFLTTRYAEASGLPIVRVQHHHAHIGAIAAEYGIEGPLLGLALDGYGFGPAGEAWGGELILHEGASARRLGSLAPLAQPGGDASAREPWRMGAAALCAIGRAEDIPRRFAREPCAHDIAALLGHERLSPPTTSCGRLFDAAAGLLGVCTHARYEAEAAMLLESLVERPRTAPGLWRIEAGELDLRALLAALADLDPTDKNARRMGAELFHGVLIEALAAWSSAAAEDLGEARVALSGGCLLNRVLAEGLIAALEQRGLTPLYPRRVPPGDGGLSLGQALVAAQTPLP